MSHRGVPQWPTDSWIRDHVISMFMSRKVRDFHRADLVREELKSYGMQVEIRQDGTVSVKY